MNPRNFWFWFSGIWLGVGLPFLLLGVYFAWDEFTLASRFARAGLRAQGIVLVKSWDSDDRHPNFRVQYRFATAAGETVRTEATITEPTWEALREQEAVSVFDLPDSPRTNRIDGWVIQWVLPAAFCGLGALLSLLGGFVLLKAISAARLLRQLEEHGHSIDARVIAVAPTGYTLNLSRQWVVRYRYRDHAGIEHDGRSPPLPMVEAQRWQPGDRVSVLFDSMRPNRSAWTGNQ